MLLDIRFGCYISFGGMGQQTHKRPTIGGRTFSLDQNTPMRKFGLIKTGKLSRGSCVCCDFQTKQLFFFKVGFRSFDWTTSDATSAQTVQMNSFLARQLQYTRVCGPSKDSCTEKLPASQETDGRSCSLTIIVCRVCPSFASGENHRHQQVTPPPPGGFC